MERYQNLLIDTLALDVYILIHWYPWCYLACHLTNHQLGQLKNLQQLSLYLNSVYGTIFPSTLGSLSSLKVLNLGRNELNGALLDILGSLTNLQELFIHNNLLIQKLILLISRILKDLMQMEVNCHCKFLLVVELGSNLYIGNIPSSLGNVRQLNSLHLRGN